MAEKIHLMEKMKKISAKISELRRLALQLRRKYHEAEEEIEAYRYHITVEPERIVSKSSDSNFNLCASSLFDISSPPGRDEVTLSPKKVRFPSIEQVRDCESNEDTSAVLMSPALTSVSVYTMSSSVASTKLNLSPVVPVDDRRGVRSLSGPPENAATDSVGLLSAIEDSTELPSSKRQSSNTTKSKGTRKKKPSLQDRSATGPNSKSSQNIADISVGLHFASTKHPCTKDLGLKDNEVSKKKSSSIMKEVRPVAKVAGHDEMNIEPLPESSQNVTGHNVAPLTTIIEATEGVGNSQKPPLKLRETNKRKKRVPNDNERRFYNLRSMPTSKSHFDENEAPVRRVYNLRSRPTS